MARGGQDVDLATMWEHSTFSALRELHGEMSCDICHGPLRNAVGLSGCAHVFCSICVRLVSRRT